MISGPSMYRQDIGHGLGDHRLLINLESMQVITHGQEEDIMQRGQQNQVLSICLVA